MSASEYREFLLSVVNADDRAESAGTRARFAKLYRGWFPPDFRGERAANAARVFLHAYSIPHMWKCYDSLQSEKPKTEFALHVATPRLFPFPDNLTKIISPSTYSNPRRLVKFCFYALSQSDRVPAPFSAEYLKKIEKEGFPVAQASEGATH